MQSARSRQPRSAPPPPKRTPAWADPGASDYSYTPYPIPLPGNDGPRACLCRRLLPFLGAVPPQPPPRSVFEIAVRERGDKEHVGLCGEGCGMCGKQGHHDLYSSAVGFQIQDIRHGSSGSRCRCIYSRAAQHVCEPWAGEFLFGMSASRPGRPTGAGHQHALIMDRSPATSLPTTNGADATAAWASSQLPDAIVGRPASDPGRGKTKGQRSNADHEDPIQTTSRQLVMIRLGGHHGEYCISFLFFPSLTFF